MNRLAVVDEVALEIVDERDHIAEHALVHSALHEEVLGAEDFRDLCQDRRTACGADAIGYVADERIGGHAREAVRAPALEPDRQRGNGARLAPVALGYGNKLLQGRQSLLQLVLGCLSAEGAQSAGVGSTDLGEQGVELVRLTAEADDEYAAGVGMRSQGGQYAPRALQIVPQL